MEMTEKQSSKLDFEKLMSDIENGMRDMGRSARRIAEFLYSNTDEAALLSTAEVAQACHVHSSSVVRFAQTLGFSGYKQLQGVLKTQYKSNLERLETLQSSEPIETSGRRFSIFVLADSGRSFNEALRTAALKFAETDNEITIEGDYVVSNEIEPKEFANKIEKASKKYDAIFLVARDHPLINDAVRKAVEHGAFVICLTTDLPASGRTCYVGSDQYASGSSAAWLVGKMAHNPQRSRVLLVYSVPFRCQQDREQGFRHILRTEFPHLILDERVSSNEDSLITHKSVSQYIEKNGPPAAIYNVSGANLGIGKALDEQNLLSDVVFIGHELNVNSKQLLRIGAMDVTIGHNMDAEISLAVDALRQARSGKVPQNAIVESQIYTRYNIPEL
jgi:LacI family transcriptional regulator